MQRATRRAAAVNNMEDAGDADSNLIKLIDKRFEICKKRDLQPHLNILKSWESRLKQIRKWYKCKGEELAKYADELMLQRRRSALDLVFQDHSYCLRAYRNNRNILIPHTCDENCVSTSTWPQSVADLSPLEIPLHLGWERVNIQRDDELSHSDIYYVAPCGRRLRNMDEVKAYLDVTGFKRLSGVHFTFDPLCSLKGARYDPKSEGALLYIEDISQGKEKTPISCVNVHGQEQPDCMQGSFEYLTTRTYEPNIPHQRQSEFLVCCSCTDNCANRSKCECWQLTQEEAKLIGNLSYSAGYVHNRLKRPQYSAVYECNSHCKCDKTQCSNYVVQAGVHQPGMRHRLQLFHTGNPKLQWGLRTLDDIPAGTFVCSYLGHVYTEKGAEKRALQHGDEYFADLDYIEVMEFYKAGYEAEVVLSDATSDSSEARRSRLTSPLRLELTEQPSPRSSGSPVSGISPSSLTGTLNDSVIYISTDSEGEEGEGEEEDCVCLDSDAEVPKSPSHKLFSSEVLDFTPSPTPTPPPMATSPSPATPTTATMATPTRPTVVATPTGGYLRTRCFYKEDFSYIVDAKSRGNMARYLNHSCDPNLYVQNVFVNSHDLRFPWVAFIAKRRIKAMEELTWDYNYEIGSVANKQIECLCGAPNCKKRLL